MIKHHPNSDLLNAFVAGELPASICAAIAIHADMCPECQQYIADKTATNADASFKENYLHNFQVDDLHELDGINFDEMLADITNNDDIVIPVATKPKQIQVKNETYQLPRAIQQMDIAKFRHLGKIARARIELDEGALHTSLLKLDADCTVPEHTHTGYEITLLLDGEFEDDMGSYCPGDFIVLDGQHTHQPTTEHGCLCFTVVSDSLHFTKGFNKLLNPIGNFIY